MAAGENVELVEASSHLPGLNYKKGLKKWTLANKENVFYSKFEEVPEVHHSLIRPTMFSEENDNHHLERCIRVLPHQQDTSGFFIAVLQKNGPCNWENPKNYENKNGSNPKFVIDKKGDSNLEEAANGIKRKSEDDEAPTEQQRPKKRSKLQERYQGYKEDPFIYLDENDSVLTEVIDYFDIQGLDHRMFFHRSRNGPDAPKNSLYFASLLVRNILETNADNLKIINTGIKAFAKCENKGAPIFMR